MSGLMVVIVGGGIGGLTAAIALQAAGIDTQIYEQAPELCEVGAGVGLWGNAVRALDALGLAGDVLALGAGSVGSGVKRPDGQWLLRQPKDVMARRWGTGIVPLHRAELQARLLAEVDRGSIHLGARCAGVLQTADAVNVRFADGRHIEADVLIGSDGVHSVVRECCLGRARLHYRGYTAWRGVTPPGSVPMVAEAIETWGRGARFGLQPTSGDRILWYATLNAPEGGTDAGQARQTLLEHFGRWHEPIRAVVQATAEASIVRNDIYDRRPTRTWTCGRVALVGDAAHPMTPDLGQGACQAIVDATTIARCLTETPDVESALHVYERRRVRNAALTSVLARTIGTVGQWEGRFGCAVRDATLKAIPLSVQLRQLDLVVGRSDPQWRPGVARV